jgi:hypothetical protein
MTDSNNTRPFPPTTGDADATDVLFGTQPTDSGTPPQPTADSERLRPRFGTIFWGVILLVFAAFMVTNAIVPFVLDPTTWVIAALVAGGVVLVVAGIAAAVRRAD